MRKRLKPAILWTLGVFLVPLALHAAIYAASDHPRRWSDADWSSAGLLDPPSASEARVLVMAASTGAWKGIFSLHSWIVLKPADAISWSRYDVVGWGRPVRVNGWAPDGRWFGNVPTILADIRGAQAEALIPRLRAAIDGYAYANAGDYRIWPGPNSNTFVATVLRAVPEMGVTLPPNAVGRDFRPGLFAGVTPAGTGIEATLFGLLGVTAGWREGIEINLLGLVAGFDLRHPALKLPGFGRIGFDSPAVAAAHANSAAAPRDPPR